MKILVTGANGMVARATTEYCLSIGDNVIALPRRDLDISDSVAVDNTVDEIRPDALLNCAAYTNVDGAETEKQLAYDVNATGVENLAAACRKFDSRFITISTDYVFDGANPGFYTQRDNPEPRGVYATTKRYGEILARNTYARSIIVRSGWIFGRGGTNFLSVVHDLLAEGKSIKAISDTYGTPTYADDLARRLRELAELDLPCTYHVTNSGNGTSYLGFVEKVCEIGGFDRDLVDPVSKNDLSRPAPRPTSSKLACLFSERLGLSPLPSWEDGLARFLAA
ncbi:MAG TPA: dTDP-4-dehydrorhamnose reductase [Pyrinomonadaceae bacterium]